MASDFNLYLDVETAELQSSQPHQEDDACLVEGKDVQVMALFDNWCTQYSELISELEKKDAQLKEAEHNATNLQGTNTRIKEECEQLQKTVSQCQKQLQTLSELEEEVGSLKSRLAEKEDEIITKATQSKAELQKTKESLQEEFEQEKASTKCEYERKLRHLEELLATEQQSKAAAERQWNTTLKDKDREMARISMEYESKLAAAERQRAQYKQQHQQMLNQDIMRKKMQHMKESHERELTSLRSQLASLQDPHAQQQTLSSPRQRPSTSVSPRQQRHPLFASKLSSPGQSVSRGKGRGRSLSVTKRSF